MTDVTKRFDETIERCEDTIKRCGLTGELATAFRIGFLRGNLFTALCEISALELLNVQEVKEEE